jgi:hypothetical protein
MGRTAIQSSDASMSMRSMIPKPGVAFARGDVGAHRCCQAACGDQDDEGCDGVRAEPRT